MKWSRFNNDNYPSKNRRILVSDGEIITIVNFIKDGDNHSWIFENPTLEDLKIFWWHDLPKLPPKINKPIINDEQQNSQTNQTGSSEEPRN